jgi:SAM-dependent methyltransferase
MPVKEMLGGISALRERIYKLLFSKVTKPNIYTFIRKYSTEKFTLDCGGGKSPHKDFFPNRVCLDIVPYELVNITGDAHHLPFRGDVFEVVLLSDVLEHFHTPVKVVQEIYRVTREGGLVIGSVPFLFPIHEAPTDFYRFTKYGLLHLFRDFTPVEIIPIFNNLESLSILTQRIGFQSKANLLVRAVASMTAKVLFKIGNFSNPSDAYGNIDRTVEEQNFMTAEYFFSFQK